MRQSIIRRLNSVTSLIFLSFLSTFVFLNVYLFVNETESITGLSSHQSIKVQTVSGLSLSQRSPFNLSKLNSSDSNRLVNLTGFKFVINNDKCHKEIQTTIKNVTDAKDQVFLLVFIHSAPVNFDKRLAIRRTWGNESIYVNHRVRLVFLLGLPKSTNTPSSSSSTLQKLIQEENDRYSDIVQGNFVDTYRNLTYKHVMGLKWVSYFCQNARFVLKTDDDVAVDIVQLIYHLKGSHSDIFPARNLMLCNVAILYRPLRDTESKWYVTKEEYPWFFYPRYCHGWAILMTPDIVFSLYLQSSKVPFFWVDDVYVTGLLAGQAGIEQQDLTAKFGLSYVETKNWLYKVDDDQLSVPPMFGPRNSDLDTVYAFWNKTIKYYRTKYGLSMGLS